jgi:hypothetical protein
MTAWTLALLLQASSPPEDGPRLAKVDFRELPLVEACRLLADQTGLNLVPSAEAGPTKVSLFLRDVPALAAVEAMCKSHELWMQRDPRTGIVRINTVKEYKRDITSFTEEKTEFFTLLYPNALDVAYAVRNLFGPRAILQPGDADVELMTDLAMRFGRFDLIDSRTQGLGAGFGTGLGAGGFGRGGAGVGFRGFSGTFSGYPGVYDTGGWAGGAGGLGVYGSGLYRSGPYEPAYGPPQANVPAPRPLQPSAEEIPTLEKLLAGEAR